jgi:hypothetical protein
MPWPVDFLAWRPRWDMAPAPATACQDSPNYVYYSDCSTLRDVSIAVNMTEEIVPTSSMTSSKAPLAMPLAFHPYRRVEGRSVPNAA